MLCILRVGIGLQLPLFVRQKKFWTYHTSSEEALIQKSCESLLKIEGALAYRIILNQQKKLPSLVLEGFEVLSKNFSSFELVEDFLGPTFAVECLIACRHNNKLLILICFSKLFIGACKVPALLVTSEVPACGLD
ncbi:hypothetical protein Tco_0812351 [Tanacetum coccineum]